MYFLLTYRFSSLVIADTKAQVINKACKAIKKFREQSPGGKFILLVDEADAMFRTYDRHQVFEQALEQLMDLGPAMVSRTYDMSLVLMSITILLTRPLPYTYQTCMMSATSVPLMMELVQSEHSKEEDIEFFNLEPHADYSGVENIKPLEVIEVEEDGSEEDGMAEETNKKLTAIFSAEQSAMKKKIYLDQNELSAKPHVADDLEVIYANEKVSFCSCGVLRCSYVSLLCVLFLY